MTVSGDLRYCEHGYASTEHCRTCEIMRVCRACKADEKKYGPFVLWHRLRNGHWFLPLSDIVPDYCRTCLRDAFDAAGRSR